MCPLKIRELIAAMSLRGGQSPTKQSPSERLLRFARNDDNLNSYENIIFLSFGFGIFSLFSV